MAKDQTKAEFLSGLYKTWNDSKGTINPFIEHFAEDVRWHSLADGGTGAEFSAKVSCKADVQRYFDMLGQDWTMNYHDMQDFIVDGDRAVALGRISWTHRRTGKVAETLKADVIRFRDGKIAEVTEYYDTAAVFAAAGG
jgi:ketosteroid isomerase-like protein